jgi:hypothetical protein
MSSRTATSLNWLELAILDHPQYVNDEGYELAEPPIEEEEVLENAAEEIEDIVMEGEGEPDMDFEAEIAGVEEDMDAGEPLLSIADRYVPYLHLERS